MQLYQARWISWRPEDDDYDTPSAIFSTLELAKAYLNTQFARVQEEDETAYTLQFDQDALCWRATHSEHFFKGWIYATEVDVE